MHIKTSKLALKISKLVKHFGLNKRLAYQLMIDGFAPGAQEAITDLTFRNPFLIVSTGRTATKWLAAILDQACGAYVVHEPVPQEEYYHAQAISYPAATKPYLYEFRIREMALRIREHNPMVYGEVNSVLRFHITALQEIIPAMKIIHLVRDGRDVVRSVFNRRIKARKTPLYDKITPPILDKFSSQWHTLTAFEKICWGWKAENQFMRENTKLRARFEDITASYPLFSQQILRPLGLSLKEELWRQTVRRPVNATKKYVVGSWDDWTDEQQQQFTSICGSEMQEYGYEIPAIQAVQGVEKVPIAHPESSQMQIQA